MQKITTYVGSLDYCNKLNIREEINRNKIIYNLKQLIGQGFQVTLYVAVKVDNSRISTGFLIILARS